MNASNTDAQRRWRLALGRYAKDSLGGMSGADIGMDGALDYLYGREYKKRGLSIEGGKGIGNLDPTQMSAIDWLGKARSLFPQDVFETLQTHALERYEISDLLNDPKTLEGLQPSQDLLKVLLGFHGRAKPEVKDKLRMIADSVIKDIMARLQSDVSRAFSGRRNRFLRSNIASAANFDWRATIRQNLKTYDQERGRIIAEQLRFNSRQQRRLPWKIILCVDQSGSMTDSLIYAAVMGAVLTGLPGVTTRMVLFDTSIVDATDHLTDPIETLLSVQLGGGTDIGKAVRYCEQFIDNGPRTIFVLLSDFCEGASPRPLYSAIARMAEARVKLLGLAALDDSGFSDYDAQIAGKLTGLGMKIGAMTPSKFANWLAEAIQ